MDRQSAVSRVLGPNGLAQGEPSRSGSQPASGPLFSLDTPKLGDGVPLEAGSPLVVTGWLIPPEDQDIQSLDLRIGDKVVVRARLRSRRPDVAEIYPDRRGATWSGFDAEVPLDRWIGRAAELDLVARWDAGQTVLDRIPLRVLQRIREQPRRERSFDLLPLLACPLCGSPKLAKRGDELRCGRWRCGATFEVRRGTPIFAMPSNPASSHLLEENFTHPYGDRALAIIRQNSRGLVLDFGAGNTAPDQRHPNVVLHEALHYPQVDVVSVLPRLPYRDGVFDAVISQAVFEHVARPWETAKELYRVLKPGGCIHVDTAFMQPFHADPCHYFNMTTSGLHQVFHQFREVAVGVKPYQAPSFGLRMQYDVMLQHLKPGKWRNRVQQFRDELEQGDLDADLDELGRRFLAAGVFFEGIKPIGVTPD
jgi:SAM-dependent methyltransferase